MQAVRLHGKGDLRVEEIDLPAPPRPGEVTLKVTAAGICGSDLHNFRTGAWISRAPSVAGHEFSGIVTTIGSDVGHVALGDRVIVDSRVICLACRACKAGRGQVCEKLGFVGEVIDGGFAEAVTLPARNVLKAADGVPDSHLAMAEPLAVALHALNRLTLPAGADLVIAGSGPIGGLVALLASRAGHHVTVIDRNEARAEKVAAVTGGRIATLEAAATDSYLHAIDTTGNAAVISALEAGLFGGGTLALVGIGHPATVLDPVRLVEREITVHGCHAFRDEELAEVNRRLPSLSDALDHLIAEEITLEGVPAAYQRLIDGKVAGLKTIIRCETA